MPIIPTNKPLKPRPKNDFYPTPLPFALAGLAGLPNGFTPTTVLDPGCGEGVWGEALVIQYNDPEMIVVGVDDDLKLNPKIGGLTLYDHFIPESFLEFNRPVLFDLVCGNPPYRYAEEFVRKGLEFLAPNGYLVFLMRLQFLGSKKRLALWGDYPPMKVVVCANRPSFTGDGKTNADEYCFMYWQKGRMAQPELNWVYVEKPIKV